MFQYLIGSKTIALTSYYAEIFQTIAVTVYNRIHNITHGMLQVNIFMPSPACFRVVRGSVRFHA